MEHFAVLVQVHQMKLLILTVTIFDLIGGQAIPKTYAAHGPVCTFTYPQGDVFAEPMSVCGKGDLQGYPVAECLRLIQI